MHNDSDVDMSWVELANSTAPARTEVMAVLNRVDKTEVNVTTSGTRLKGGGLMEEVDGGERRLEMVVPWVGEPGALLRDVERVLAIDVKDRDRVEELFRGRMSREEQLISRRDGAIESELESGDGIDAAVRQSDDTEESSDCKDQASVEDVAEGMAEESGEDPGFQGSDHGTFDGNLVVGVKGEEDKVVKEFKGLVDGIAAAYEPGESYLCSVPWMTEKGFEHHRPCLCPGCGVKRNQLMGSGRRSAITENTGRLVSRKEDGRPLARTSAL